jgi:xanthine dehydrogenase iron-sulfur cluster and FAD-binding subunit A
VELSGVLCRCTGYRNILSAVADITRSYPDGITPPLNSSPTEQMRATGVTSVTRGERVDPHAKNPRHRRSGHGRPP